MSKFTRTNRICIPCRLKFPGVARRQESLKSHTQHCCKCGSDLTEVHDSIKIPKKTDTKGWEKLEELISNNYAKEDENTPQQRKQDLKLHFRKVREQRRGFGLTITK